MTRTSRTQRKIGALGLLLGGLVLVGACSPGTGSSSSGPVDNDPYGVHEEVNRDYFDDCLASEGCGVGSGY